MFKTVSAALVALSLFAGAAGAATESCDAAKLSSQVDRYANQPFSALNYRVLSGLGDPGVEPADTFDMSWQATDEYKKLAKSVLPATEQMEIGYDCRTGYPLAVLKSLISKFGANDPYVVQWVKVQGQVFESCTKTDVAPPTLIDPLTGIDAAREEAQRADRAYQTASIAFYRDKSKAVELFRQIAATSSPHKAAARYNIANLLANGKQVDAARKEANDILADASLASVHTITKQLLGYVANLEDTAAGWSALIDDAAKTITSPSSDILSSDDKKAEFARALSDIDYAGVRRKDSNWWIEGTLPENPTISKAIVDASRNSPLALWVMGGQSLYEKQQLLPWALRGKLWQEYAGSYTSKVLAIAPAGQQLPPLAAQTFSLLKQGTSEEDRAALWNGYQQNAGVITSSCGSAPETAALGVVAEQAFRAAVVQGKFDDIYAELMKQPLKGTYLEANRLLPQLMAYFLSTANVEEGRRFRDKVLTPEFISSFPEASRQQVKDAATSFMAWIAEDEARWRTAVQDNSMRMASPLFNFLTTEQLWKQSEDEAYTDEQRALLARAAWTREYATRTATSASKLAKMLALNPMIGASDEEVTKEYPKLTAEQHQLLLVLRNPRLSIMVNAPSLWSTDTLELSADSSYTDVGEGDHNDRNWWCPLEMDRHLNNLRSNFDGDARIFGAYGYGAEEAKLLVEAGLKDAADKAREKVLANHPVIKEASWKELQSLAKARSAPKKLTLAAIAWGKSTKQPDGVAEALAEAVKATRYGCNWHGGHGAYSKQAQELLKSKFGSTSYAAATPYYFDCMDSVWNDKGERVTNCKPKEWPKQTIPGQAK